tara:strand:+ start:173 stop:376 length:204 start_codon:yes stop_codon:yes gene_type:complete
MYELKLTVRTTTDPHGLLHLIYEDIKEHVTVLSMDYNLISQRPTTDLHHGGNTELDTSFQKETQTKA